MTDAQLGQYIKGQVHVLVVANGILGPVFMREKSLPSVGMLVI